MSRYNSLAEVRSAIHEQCDEAIDDLLRLAVDLLPVDGPRLVGGSTASGVAAWIVTGRQIVIRIEPDLLQQLSLF